MFRKISAAVFCFMFSIGVFAQFTPERHYLGPSVGLSFLGSAPQLGVNYEYSMVVQDFGTIGIGGIFRYWGYSEDYHHGKWSYSNVMIGAQGNYHFKLNTDKFDPWAGLVLAYHGGSVSWDGPHAGYASPSHGGFFLGLQGGVRYWFTPTLAGTARLGFGTLSYGSLEVGVDFKL